MTIRVAFLILPSLPDVAGRATGIVIAKTIGRQAMIVPIGAAAAAGVATEAMANDEGVARITDKKAER